MSNKIKVAIADDERMVCVVIQKSILWDELNLELVGIAHNGEELLDVIQTQKPHIVITDINMPGFNGLEIIELVKKRNIICKFIVVSGYRQFEYAQKAIRYNVEDYLLKPIDAQELNNALSKSIMAILSEHGGEETEIQLKSKKDKSNLRRMFLNSILDKSKELSLDNDLVEEEYGIAFKDGIYQAIQIKLDLLDGELADVPDENESIQNKIMSIFTNLFEMKCNEILMDGNFERIWIGIYYDVRFKDEMNSKFQEFFEYTKNVADLFINLKVTIGIGRRYDTLSEFPKSFQEADEAINFRIIYGVDQVIYWDRLTLPERRYSENELAKMKSRLICDFEILDIEDFKKYITEIFFISKKTCHATEMIELCFFIEKTFFELEHELGTEIEHEEFFRKVIRRKIKNAITINDLRDSIMQPIMKVMNELFEKIQSQNRKPIREALEYIEQHYMEMIRLEDIADTVNLNPAYFSTVFKKETGENFLDYVHLYRVNIAKDMLRNNNHSVIDIAMSVGYNDAKYFSKVFKKYVGIKPTDYRKIYG